MNGANDRQGVRIPQEFNGDVLNNKIVTFFTQIPSIGGDLSLEGDTFKIEKPGHYQFNIEVPEGTPRAEYKIIICLWKDEIDTLKDKLKKVKPGSGLSRTR